MQRGSAKTEANVTIDGEAPTLRFGEQWHHEKSVDNSAGAVRRVTEITATRPTGGVNNGPVTARQKGSRFIPPPVEMITYDDDGNQTTNAQWTYTWDGENRLIAAEESLAVLLQPTGAAPVKRQRLEFAYDSLGRRFSKRVLTAEGTSTTFVLKQGIKFLYDGWNMIAEIDTTQTAPRLLRSYEWGLDVSETMDEAGGVGGLLIERFTDHNSMTGNAHIFAPCFDGVGNVTELVGLVGDLIGGRYEYGAFGETVYMEQTAQAANNPWRFGSKHREEELGLSYYGFRYYDDMRGRWLGRDPMFEVTGMMPEIEGGGTNLYGMLGNDALNAIDFLGMWSITRTSANMTATACAAEGDTPKALADKIGLSVNDAQKWMKPYKATYKAKETVAIPNVVIAFWAGELGKVGRSSVNWNGSVSYLKKIGFYVDDQLGSKDLSSFFSSHSSNGSLHGLYYWGHGGTPNCPGCNTYLPKKFNRSTNPADMNCTGSTCQKTGEKYASDGLYTKTDNVLQYSQTGLHYKMAMGFVFACWSDHGKAALLSGTPGSIWHGYSRMMIPIIDGKNHIKNFIKPPKQGTTK